jgi:hypothetical protein
MPEVLATDSKICRKCLTRKSLDQFNRDSSAKDGRQKYCRPCQNERNSAWAKANVRKRTDYTREWSKANPDKIFNNYLRHFYGIDKAEYDEMSANQNGVCAICAQPERFKKFGKVMRLSVDHCHGTGMVRGLLCSRCNNGLGHMNDDPQRMRAAIAYLERHAS